MSTDCTGVGGRGCPCPYHAQRKVYARNYARRQAAKKLAAAQRSARVCPRKFGRFGTCGTVLEHVIVQGRVVVVCAGCDRMARGICRDCPRRVDGQVGKARYCAEHKRLADAKHAAKYRATHRPELAARAKRAYQEDEQKRQERIARNKRWRMLNPDGVKAQKRRHALKQSERDREYMRQYREKHRERINAAERARYYGVAPLRTCIEPGCDIVVTGRKKKCSRCKQRDAQQVAA